MYSYNIQLYSYNIHKTMPKVQMFDFFLFRLIQLYNSPNSPLDKKERKCDNLIMFFSCRFEIK